MVDEASVALTSLDADALEQLGRRAEALSQLNQGSAGIGDRALITALEKRFRRFSAVVQATGENLTTLQRAGGTGGFAAYSAAPRGLFESMGLYGEADGGASIWPRARGHA